MNRRAATESVADLSALVRQQFKTLEDAQSGFALSMAQTMRDAFAGLEGRHKYLSMN